MPNKIKLLILLGGLAILILLLSRCSNNDGNYTATRSKSHNSKTSMEMSYDNFNGYKYKILKLKKGDKLTLNIKLNNDSGDLTVSLIDKSDKELYKTGSLENSVSQTILIPKSGKYKIQVQGDHSGGFKISWDVIK
ncbi:hypothetical protein [Clostridium sp.]|uniref:hypothetical protein n=1 Tax=Clostridium sp. TaxID=1506 RepID=UPI0032173F27